MMRHMKQILICSCAFAWCASAAFADSTSLDLYGGDDVVALTALRHRPGDPRSQATIRIGDTNYWTLRRNAMGDMRHITVRDVTSTAKAGVWVKGLLCDSEISDIRVTPDAKRYEVTVQTERVTFGDATP